MDLYAYFENLPEASRIWNEVDDSSEEENETASQKSFFVSRRYASNTFRVKKKDDTHPLTYDTLVIALRGAGSWFALAHGVGEKKIIGVIERIHTTKENKVQPSEMGAMVLLSEGTVMVICNEDVEEEDARAVSDLIFHYLSIQKRVVILDTLSPEVLRSVRQSYKSGSFEPPIVRQLCTSGWSGEEEISVPSLESPCVVGGLGASVLTHCEIRGMKAILLGSLGDVKNMEEASLHAFYDPLLVLLPSSFSEKPLISYTNILRMHAPRPSRNVMYL